jgi:hypothetical protein
MSNIVDEYFQLIERNELSLNFFVPECVGIDKTNKKVYYNSTENTSVSKKIKPTYKKYRTIDVISLF